MIKGWLQYDIFYSIIRLKMERGEDGMKRSVWLHLFLPVASLILAFFVVLGVVEAASAEEKARTAAYRELAYAAEKASVQLQERLEEQASELTRFAARLSGQTLTVADAMTQLRASFPGTDLRRTAVVSASGIAYYDDGVTADIASDAGFQTALSGACAVEARKGERSVREGRIVLSAPVGENAEWVVLCGMTDDALIGLLESFSGTDGIAVLAKSDGSVILTSNEQSPFTGNLFSSLLECEPETVPEEGVSDGGVSETLASFLQSETAGSMTLTYAETGRYNVSCAPVGLNGWMLFCCEPCAESDSRLTPVLLSAVAALAGLALLTLLASVRLRKNEAENEQLAAYSALTNVVLEDSVAELWRYDADSNAFVRTTSSRSNLESGRDEPTGSVADELAVQVSSESRPAFRQMVERIRQGERVVSEVLRVRNGRYLRFTFRNRFNAAGESCGADGYAEDWTLRQELCRRVDQQNSRMDDRERDVLLAVRWNVSRDTLEKTVGMPSDKPGASPRSRLLAALAPKKPALFSGLTAGRLLRQYDVCNDWCEMEFDQRGASQPVRLEICMMRAPDTLDVLAFLFLHEQADEK